MVKRSPKEPKKIVYLWGAGATQAEADYLGGKVVNLLMRDNKVLGVGLSSRILEHLGGDRLSIDGEHGVDIEKLISLLAASGVRKFETLAERIRRLYFEEIRSSLKRKKLTEPSLAIGLLEMHSDQMFRQQTELLTGFISMNHDGFLHAASQRVLKKVNLGFKFQSKDFTCCETEEAPLLLHIHGSFCWRFSVPMTAEPVQQKSPYRPDTVWIPPTILKESKSYPFNKLNALAYELLSKHCDVLRVVGCSLTQNDWNVLSMLFNAQRHQELTSGGCFKIELILRQYDGVWVRKECSYLKNLMVIGDLTDGKFDAFKDYDYSDPPRTSAFSNPFAYWLAAKADYHRARCELSDGLRGSTLMRIIEER